MGRRCAGSSLFVTFICDRGSLADRKAARRPILPESAGCRRPKGHMQPGQAPVTRLAPSMGKSRRSRCRGRESARALSDTCRSDPSQRTADIPIVRLIVDVDHLHHLARHHTQERMRPRFSRSALKGQRRSPPCAPRCRTSRSVRGGHVLDFLCWRVVAIDGEVVETPSPPPYPGQKLQEGTLDVADGRYMERSMSSSVYTPAFSRPRQADHVAVRFPLGVVSPPTQQFIHTSKGEYRRSYGLLPVAYQ
jgi:hypothetical protein